MVIYISEIFHILIPNFTRILNILLDYQGRSSAGRVRTMMKRPAGRIRQARSGPSTFLCCCRGAALMKGRGWKIDAAEPEQVLPTEKTSPSDGPSAGNTPAPALGQPRRI